MVRNTFESGSRAPIEKIIVERNIDRLATYVRDLLESGVKADTIFVDRQGRGVGEQQIGPQLSESQTRFLGLKAA